jgi:hypothetical protein
MATYYKYAEREADSFVNWAEIGKNLSEMLQTENQLREDKKAAIDKASREFGEELANAPTGEHQGANAWTLNYASDAQQARLLQDRLLKSGQLKLKDYNIMRQNINDGTKQVFNLSKEYQDEYKVKMERAKSADPATASQELESFLMSSVEGFANFSKSKILINPTDFQISVGIMEPDPENQGVMKLTNNVETVNNLRNRIKAKFDKFDTQKETEAISGRMATYITAEITRGSDARAGQVTTVEDAMKRPGYKKAVEDAINSYLTNPYNISSILTEDIGTDESGVPFQFTFDEKEAKGKSNIIFLERDPASGLPKPAFTPEQEQAARDFMRGQIEQQIVRKEDIRPFSEPQQSEFQSKKGQDVKAAEEGGNMLAKLYSGDAGEIQAAVDHFNGYPNVSKVDRTQDAVVVTLTDGQTKTIRFKNPDGTPISQQDFIRAASPLFIGAKSDINAVLKGAVGTGKTEFNATGTAASAAQTNNPSKMYSNHIESVITTNVITSDEDVTKANLSPLITNLGFSVEIPTRPGRDIIVIRNKDGVRSPEINLKNPAAALKEIQGFMLSNIPGKNAEEKFLYLTNLKNQGTLSGGGVDYTDK